MKRKGQCTYVQMVFFALLGNSLFCHAKKDFVQNVQKER